MKKIEIKRIKFENIYIILHMIIYMLILLNIHNITIEQLAAIELSSFIILILMCYIIETIREKINKKR